MSAEIGETTVPRVDISQTQQFQETLASELASAASFAGAVQEAQAAFATERVSFEQRRTLTASLSVLGLTPSDVDAFRCVAEQLHEIVEYALDWVVASEERVRHYFPDHARMLPYLVRTPGTPAWQGYSRYDAVVDRQGHIRVIELNACCPAGFLHGPVLTDITAEALRNLGVISARRRMSSASLSREDLLDGLLATERDAGLEPGLIVLVNDENNLQNELDLLQQALRNRGREVVVANASELYVKDGRVECGGRRVTLTHNKIRVSTPDSPNHCWRDGFETRYRGFLDGIVNGMVASMNNLCCASIGEDKGMLALLHDPAFQAELSQGQRAFIDEHVAWTARLPGGGVQDRGRDNGLLSYVREHPEQFVIKPANEGRGFGVLVGRYCDDAQWQQACRQDPGFPHVVQAYQEPAPIPVVLSDAEDAAASGEEMHLTVAMGLVRGHFCGLFSRACSDPVTNVGKTGLAQAVLVHD